MEPDLIDLFIAPLEKAGIHSYMVSGSVASIEYGEPRATLDLDMALLLTPQEALRLPQIFPVPDYYLPLPEVILAENARPVRGHFNIIHLPSGLKADCYPSRSHPWLNWALAHRQQHQVRGTSVWFAPPEYVILWKLEFHREGGGEKHLRDIRGILAVSADQVDLPFLRAAVEQSHLTESWNTALSTPI